jgi:hypothetical protein
MESSSIFTNMEVENTRQSTQAHLPIETQPNSIDQVNNPSPHEENKVQISNQTVFG